MSSSHYTLLVTKQSSLSMSRRALKEGGAERDIHTVVKQSPFALELGIVAGLLPPPHPPIDLKSFIYSASLVYANEPTEPESAVDYLRTKPFDVKFNVDPSGSKVSMECRLKILSSQRENQCFCLRFDILDPETKLSIGLPLINTETAVSEPIRVISKPEHTRKPKPSKKRSINDVLMESLSHVEEHQIAVISRMREVLSQSHAVGSTATPTLSSSSSSSSSSFSSFSPSSSSFSHSHLVSPARPYSLADDPDPLLGSSPLRSSPRPSPITHQGEAIPIRHAFQNLLSTYAMLSPADRQAKLRSILQIFGTSAYMDRITEMIDLFSVEGAEHGLQREIGTTFLPQTHNLTLSPGGLVNGQCICPTCPARIQLQQVEDFYKDMFSV